MTEVERSRPGPDWISVSETPLPLGDVVTWTMQPGCGAVVTFCGTVRDHSEDRSGVVSLEYEAYMEHVEPSLAKVAAAARSTWPDIGRLALLHRVGRLEVGEVSVVVAVSTPHRAEAFDAARFCIDTVKESVPIWKRETWADGSAWAVCSHDFVAVERDRHPAADAVPSVGG
jgi:molybdopterin synthase catalytic subunit